MLEKEKDCYKSWQDNSPDVTAVRDSKSSFTRKIILQPSYFTLIGSTDLYTGLRVGVCTATLNFPSNMYLSRKREGARVKKRQAADAVSIEI